MSLISLLKASKDFGIKKLFKELDLHINEKERLGLIGPNGSGKSTLLKIIAGIEPLLEGKRHCSSSIRIELVSQNTYKVTERSVLEEVLEGCGKKREVLLRFNKLSQELEAEPENKELLKNLGEISDLMDASQAWDLEHQCQEILRKLGIKNLNKPIKELSGGYRKRVGLASALVANPDVLLLDEPTNHLDASTVEWLQNWLDNYHGALVLVTHDRYVLDRVTKRMIEVNKGEIRKYMGNYSSYLAQKIEQANSESSTKKKFQGTLRKELKWLRQGPKARSSKQKARLQRIAEMQSANTKTTKKSMEILSLSRRMGKTIIEANDLLVKTSEKDESKILFDKFTYSFDREDRVGIIGSNGTGKSTLLDVIAGRRKANGGTIQKGETIHIGYLDQKTNDLTTGKGLERKVIEFIEESAFKVEIGEQTLTASQLLERFLFNPALQHSSLSKLSGGEKRRLILCKILIERPNVLLMDEPTNDLDIQTLSVLENFIEDFKGCVIIVSHDRYFLDRTVDRIFNFEEGKLNRFEGNYTDFLNKKNLKYNKEKNSGNLKKSNVNENSKHLKSSIKLKKLSFKETRELQELDKYLPLLEKKKSSIEILINKGDCDILQKSKELANIVEIIRVSEERWLELSEIALFN